MPGKIPRFLRTLCHTKHIGSAEREKLWRQGPPRARQPRRDDERRKRQAMTGQEIQKDHIWDADTLHEECGVFGIFGHADAGALSGAGPARASASRPGSGRHRHLRQWPVHRRAACRAWWATRSGAIPTPRATSRAVSRSAMCAIPPPAAPMPATSSRSSPIWPAAASPSPITAISPTRMRCAPNWWRKARSSSPPPTPKPSCIWRRAAAAVRIVDKLIDALRQVEGAYSLVALTSKKLIGVRDPLRRAAAGAGHAGRRAHPGLGNLRAGHHRRGIRARHQAGRDGGDHQGRHRKPFPLQAAAAPLLRLRIYLFRAARFHDGRPQRL